MKNYLTNTLLLVMLLSYSTSLSAQTEEQPILVTVETLERDFGKSSVTKELKEEPKHLTTAVETKDYFRHHKKLPKTFAGYAIELTTSDFPLARDYHLFEQFGTVFYEKRKGQGYAYLIMIDFSSKKAIEDYIKNIIIHKAPEAKLVEYKKGKRSKG